MPLNPPLASFRGQRVWIVGASSGIGAELARALHRDGARVALSARRRDVLETLIPKGEDVVVAPMDATDTGAVARAHRNIVEALGGCDWMIYVAGNYVPMRADDFDGARAKSLFETNVFGLINVLGVALPERIAARSGGIAIVASVAGFRGLPRALAYGATKASLIHMAESLYMDLKPYGVSVSVINPGFVKTPLTSGNDFEMPALIEADVAARALVQGLCRGQFEIDFPRRFTWIMRILRWMPNALYFPLVRRFTGL